MLILHLSDIHFRKMEIETAQDPNFHLRNEIVRDAVAQCSVLGVPDVIILSGDIAFAGHPDEYLFATDWLEKLCNECGASLKTVFVCPGNHDVVRAKADRNMVQLVHDRIKNSTNPTAEISVQLRDADARRLLYEGLDNYNAFALQFFCDLLPPERTRATRDIPLSDGSILRLWGLNTAVVSSGLDKERDLFVDQASLQIPRVAGVINLVVAHHHLSWLRQGQELEDHLNDVAPIQMFGHVHTNRILKGEGAFMRMTASAMHPDRTEPNWEPGYNLLQVSVQEDDRKRKLNLRAHVRVWQNAPGGFRAKAAKGGDVWEQTIDLEDWSPSLDLSKNDAPRSALDSTVDTVHGDLSKEPRIMNTLRDVGLRFYRLTFSKKSEIAGRLGLLEDDDMSQPDYERFRRVFQRAHERGLLDALAEAVRAEEKA